MSLKQINSLFNIFFKKDTESPSEDELKLLAEKDYIDYLSEKNYSIKRFQADRLYYFRRDYRRLFLSEKYYRKKLLKKQRWLNSFLFRLISSKRTLSSLEHDVNDLKKEQDKIKQQLQIHVQEILKHEKIEAEISEYYAWGNYYIKLLPRGFKLILA